MTTDEEEDLFFVKKPKTLVCPNLTDYIRKSGIYKLIFDDTFFYIGRSGNLSRRLLHWIDKFYKIDHLPATEYMASKIPLSFRKIEVVVLEICHPDSLEKKEDGYICENFYDEKCLNQLCSLGKKELPAHIKKPKAVPIKDESSDFKPLFISKTKWEWDVILKKVVNSGKKDLSFFIRHEVWKLGLEYINDNKPIHEEMGRKICKRPYIPIESYKKLEIIAEQMKIPVSSVVEKLIIQPLLRSSFLNSD